MRSRETALQPAMALVDSALPENERDTWYYYHSINPDTPVHPSGLLEDVKILAY